MSFSFLSSAFSERIILFDRKARRKKRIRVARKIIMSTLKVGCAFQSKISALQTSDGISPSYALLKHPTDSPGDQEGLTRTTRSPSQREDRQSDCGERAASLLLQTRCVRSDQETHLRRVHRRIAGNVLPRRGKCDASDRILAHLPLLQSATLPHLPSHCTEHHAQFMIHGGILSRMQF